MTLTTKNYRFPTSFSREQTFSVNQRLTLLCFEPKLNIFFKTRKYLCSATKRLSEPKYEPQRDEIIFSACFHCE
jgi:hypothetical protein